jgi:hypothetical protein
MRREASVPATNSAMRQTAIIVISLFVLMSCAFESIDTDVRNSDEGRRRSSTLSSDSVTVYERSNRFRHYRQVYIEDSASVFWVRSSDPFGPVPNAYIGCKGEIKSYYNNLNGRVEIGLISQRTDSLLYSFREMRTKYRFFWICIAEEDINENDLPGEYFKSTSNEPLDLVLIVDGRLKSRLPVGIKVPVGKYCLLSWGSRYSRLPMLK